MRGMNSVNPSTDTWDGWTPCRRIRPVVALEFGDHYLIALSLLNMGNVQIAQGAYAAACTSLEEAITRHRIRGDTEAMSSPLGTLGRALYELGEFRAARDCQAEALTLRVTAGEQRGVAVSLGNLAPIELSQGRPGVAPRLLGAAEAIREAIRSPIIPARRGEYDRLVTSVHAALGEVAFK